MFSIYPYLNVNDLNLDYLLNTLTSLKSQLENFIALNTIKYANPIQWNVTSQYEANTVVIDANDGTAYLSVAPVPSGVAITNTDYWTPIFTLNLLSANQNITFRDDGANVLATFSSAAGDWLIWNNALYKVSRAINVNEAYVVGYNLTRYSVELFLNDAIGVVDSKIGDLTNLNTADKTNIVNAINSIFSNTIDTPQMYGALGDGVNDDTQAVTDCLNSTAQIHIFPEGVYNVTGVKATDMKNCIIWGYGAKLNMTNINTASYGSGLDSWVLSNVDSEPQTLNYDNGFIGIYGLEVDGNADLATVSATFNAPSILATIKLFNYDVAHFKDVVVHHTMTGQGIQVNNVRDATFENCVAHDIGYAAYHYMGYVPGSSYEWDALGVRSSYYDYNLGTTITGSNESLIIKNCHIYNVAGTSTFGINTTNLTLEGNKFENCAAYICEDSAFGIGVVNYYYRNIFDNTYFRCGTWYAWNSAMSANECVYINIHDNVASEQYGMPIHSKVTAHGISTIYDSAHLGYVEFNFANNKIHTASSYNDNSHSYGGFNLGSANKINIINNIFIWNNPNAVNYSLLGSAPTSADIFFIDNICRGYWNYTLFEISASASGLDSVYDISDNIIENYNAQFSGTLYRNACFSFGGSSIGFIKLNNNITNVGYVATIQSTPKVITCNNNYSPEKVVMRSFTGTLSNILGEFIGNLQYGASPIENLSLSSKSVSINNVNLS